MFLFYIGTGKTRLSKLISEKTGLKYLDIGQIVKENPQLHDGTDPEFDALVIDDDKLNEFLEHILLQPSSSSVSRQPTKKKKIDSSGTNSSSSSSSSNTNSNNGDSIGYIVDFHSPEVFNEDWFDLILVLKCSTNILYDRLVARGYNKKKINENMECEIMQIVLEGCQEGFEKELIHELDSNDDKDMNANIDRISLWYENWKTNQRGNDNDASHSTLAASVEQNQTVEETVKEEEGQKRLKKKSKKDI